MKHEGEKIVKLTTADGVTSEYPLVNTPCSYIYRGYMTMPRKPYSFDANADEEFCDIASSRKYALKRIRVVEVYEYEEELECPIRI